uniref:J domain-containing protein n=1 Tax=Skeletonema marinoi TaxID=267567 RepID=A0A7S2PH78_9STRA|mmetsp:Transcript_21707/g.36917  ORF Transcript_21707/g.36917 Transcript_21707/m.36917 type:complete len:1199 (+) Transcript_21707:166-3762(+)
MVQSTMEEKGKPKRRNNKHTNCRYGAECRNIGKGCKFVHPPQTSKNTPSAETVDATTASATNNKQNQKKTKEKRDKSKIPCRYGMDCLHSKCPYFHHPSAGAAAGSSPSSGEGSSPKQCTVVPPPAPTAAATNNGESATSPPPTTPSRKATNKKKCRWGAGCRNKKCAFTHPAPRTSSSSATTTTTAASSEGGGGVEAMTKSPVVVKSPAGRNSLGEVYSVNTPPSGFQSTDTTTSSQHRQKQQIIFPSLSLSPEKKVLQPTTTTSRTNTTGNTTKISPPLANPPGFGGHSPLFAKGMVGSNHSTPLSNGLANNGGGGINKNNMYSSYLSNATASATTPTTSTTMMAAEKGGQQQQQRTPLYSKEVLPAFTSLPGNQPTVNGATMNGGAFHAVNPPTMNGGGGGGFHNSQFLQSGNGGMAPRTTTSATMQMQQRLDGDDPQNLPIDADWLHEVLGIDGLDINEPAVVAAAASQQMHHNMHHNNHHHHQVNVKPRGVANGGMGADNMWEKSLETMPRQQPPTPAVANVPPTTNVFHRKVEVSQEPIDPYDDSEDELPGVILISEDEIGQSRRAALELRLESQQSAHQNADFFFSLLEKCRTNQKKVQSALEESMDPTNGGAKDLDEGNVMALLELNELLIGAIGVAESSEVHKSFVRSDAKAPKVTAPKSTAPKAAAKPVKVSPPEPKSEPPPKVVEKPPPPKVEAVAKGNDKQAKPKKAKKEVQFSAADTASKKAPEKKAPENKTSIPDESEPEPKIDPAEAARQEKEKIARLMQEARQQAAANKEKKKSKKSKKFDKWVKEQEQAKESRAKLWEKKISKENDYIGLIQKLIVAEFLRQSKEKAMGLTSDRVLSDSQAADIIDDECRKAYHTIFRELKVRILVAGSDNKDLNGRNGTIRFWDKEKKKFCVGLDTKKTADSDVLFLEPEVLDVTVSTRSNKSDKSKPASSYDFKVSDLMTYGGVSLGLNFTLKKSHINALGSAENTKIGLEVFCRQRDEEDRQKKLEEEREKADEEEARKRRAANKAKEAAAWEKKREQMRRDKEEYERMQREWRMNDEDDEEECKCPRCRFGDKFSNRGGAFFFNIGGLPFRVRFDDYESDEESFFDEFDDRWEEQMLEEKREENRKMAKVLGVEPNSDERTLKVAYRKLALKFHPDKWRSDSDHGMSRKDAENKFKTIQSAYDHLMSNFDNSDEDYA